jgi:hypothetical protein
MHQRSLEHFNFDSVLLPYSYVMMQNPTYKAGFEDVLRICRERNVAVQTIKSITRRPYNDRPRSHATWYEPLTDQDSIDKNVHWVLGLDGIFLNTVGDITVLPKVLDAANRFVSRPSDEVMQAMVRQWEMEPLFT